MNKFPLRLLQELRTDHAGETGAVMIYRGILAVSKNDKIRSFATHHLDTEQRHLALIEEIISPQWHSWLLPFWRISGWLIGALPAIFGPTAVFATIQAVETFVDKHYLSQIEMIDALIGHEESACDSPSISEDEKVSLRNLRALLAECRADEINHRDDAQARWSGNPNTALRAWIYLVGSGSHQAVKVCRHL
ncbi:demethoxyubiquinone hydroxylase family protein [Polynucleobacter brandtiae]|uniref:Ubiquinone biosynthesis monooxygenase Coq7 n=1 Tax=Polynucleobacter brandtiae TaxID=1938816 RepID=A0A2M8VHA0_9BURK|nr:demethoxyubiquinone hydroxylase family protein [Polynucleobacter brandtiae]PJI76057.1 ubiquinone biosynthesis monooxygenase Coq7 [Polynucleobacter brandtiae]